MKLEELSITRKARKFKMSSAITCNLKGKFKKTNSFLEKCLEFIKLGRLDYYGKLGVAALRETTPKDTGLLASSWHYKIVRRPGLASLIFYNTDIENGKNVALLVYYGHGTKNGIYVPPNDYITPAMIPVLMKIAEDMRKEIEAL